MSDDTFDDVMARIDAVVAGKTERARMAPSTPRQRPTKDPRECSSCSAVLDHELQMRGRTRCVSCQIDRAGGFGVLVDGDIAVGLKGEDALGAKPVGMRRPGSWSRGSCWGTFEGPPLTAEAMRGALDAWRKSAHAFDLLGAALSDADVTT